MSCIVLRGRWCNIVVLNVHAPSEDKSGDSKGRFVREFRAGFLNNFPKYHMEIDLGDFNAKVGRETIFKPTIGNESLYQDNFDNGDRIVKSATSKNLARYSRTETLVSTPGPLLMGRFTTRLITY